MTRTLTYFSVVWFCLIATSATWAQTKPATEPKPCAECITIPPRNRPVIAPKAQAPAPPVVVAQPVPAPVAPVQVPPPPSREVIVQPVQVIMPEQKTEPALLALLEILAKKETATVVVPPPVDLSPLIVRMDKSNELLAEQNRIAMGIAGSERHQTTIGVIDLFLDAGQLVTGIMTVDRLGKINGHIGDIRNIPMPNIITSIGDITAAGSTATALGGAAMANPVNTANGGNATGATASATGGAGGGGATAISKSISDSKSISKADADAKSDSSSVSNSNSDSTSNANATNTNMNDNNNTNNNTNSNTNTNTLDVLP